MKPEIRSWFQIYFGVTDKNSKHHCIGLLSLGKHCKNMNACQTTKNLLKYSGADAVHEVIFLSALLYRTRFKCAL